MISEATSRANAAALPALARILERLGGASSWWTTFALVTGVLLLEMAPVQWNSNEINYIDLALKFVAPEQFAATSAVFDESAGRFFSFGLLGLLAEIAGRDLAMVIGRGTVILAYAAALATLAHAWRLSPAEGSLGLVAFLLLGQNYFAGEWLFGGVEAKTLAYPCVILAVAWALPSAGGWAIGAAALATYLHFLVGGFWAGAALLLLVIRGTPLAYVARLGLAYIGLVAPLVAILVYERLIVAAPDLSGMNEIYAVFRAPHHVAPFVSVDEFRRWSFGIAEMMAASLLVGLAWATHGALRSIAVWLLVLNGYLALCFVVAFFDRGTHALAPLYIFRPNSMILLLTLLLLTSWLRGSLRERESSLIMGTFFLAALLLHAPPRVAALAVHVARAQPIPVTPTLGEAPEAMIEWLREQTVPESVVVIEPTAVTNWETGWIAFERRSGRPSLVSSKFVPTAPQDFARWYQLVRWREAVFAGGCHRLKEEPVDYLVVVTPETLERMARCGKVVWHRDAYGIVAVRESPTANRTPAATPVE